DLERLAGHVDADGRLEQGTQEWEQETETRLLDHPRPVCVEAQQDIAERTEMVVADLVGNRPDVEVSETPPVEPRVVQEAVAETSHVLALPEPLRILLVDLRGDALGTEVRAGHVEETRDRRRSRPVHPQDDQLHGGSLTLTRPPPPSRARTGGTASCRLRGGRRPRRSPRRSA